MLVIKKIMTMFPEAKKNIETNEKSKQKDKDTDDGVEECIEKIESFAISNNISRDIIEKMEDIKIQGVALKEGVEEEDVLWDDLEIDETELKRLDEWEKKMIEEYAAKDQTVPQDPEAAREKPQESPVPHDPEAEKISKKEVNHEEDHKDDDKHQQELIS